MCERKSYRRSEELTPFTCNRVTEESAKLMHRAAPGNTVLQDFVSVLEVCELAVSLCLKGFDADSTSENGRILQLSLVFVRCIRI